jgi:hypothetical protein
LDNETPAARRCPVNRDQQGFFITARDGLGVYANLRDAEDPCSSDRPLAARSDPTLHRFADVLVRSPSVMKWHWGCAASA